MGTAGAAAAMTDQTALVGRMTEETEAAGSRGTDGSTAGELSAAEAVQLLRARQIRYLRLGFTDIFGVARSMEVTAGRFEHALAGQVMFDGSAMDGDAREEESDMLLRPLPGTLRFPPDDPEAASVVCAVHRPDGGRFEGDPRGSLERAVAALAALGLEARVGADLEFFLFRLGSDGRPTRSPHDDGGYYEVSQRDRSAAIRREIAEAAGALGIGVRASLHEVAPGQQRLELESAPALDTADALLALRVAVQGVAASRGLHASFMPKPLPGASGSGLHLHHSLWREGTNRFLDVEARDELSDLMRYYVGGLLRHARAYCAVTNPLVNSYKRLAPGFDAPVNVAWSLHTRSPMIRIPMDRGPETRCEVRIADAAANPYLALAVQMAAGVAGLREELDPGEPINKNLWTLTPREKQRLRVQELPRHLGEALDELEQDRITRAALGEYIFSRFVAVKRQEWLEYLAHVHPWEVERYL